MGAERAFVVRAHPVQVETEDERRPGGGPHLGRHGRSGSTGRAGTGRHRVLPERLRYPCREPSSGTTVRAPQFAAMAQPRTRWHGPTLPGSQCGPPGGRRAPSWSTSPSCRPRCTRTSLGSPLRRRDPRGDGPRSIHPGPGPGPHRPARDPRRQGGRWSIDPDSGAWTYKTAMGDVQFDHSPPESGSAPLTPST